VFRKILIANRGEIAVRVIRACRELGVRTVAVYSDADANAPHVRFADEAVLLGPAPSSESYLRADRIVDAARACGADAIHPGYGFLSEREPFARLVQESGLVWIGPPPSAIAAMGNKTNARRLVRRAGVPLVPGTMEDVGDAAQAESAASRLGYPVLLKAVAGGGGKGMRLVTHAGQLPAALEAARREARNAFGDEAVYIEKYIEGPRHVEIQILADQHGSVISLGERECSMQRRHQKMIEEAPSIAVSPMLRRRMSETAVAAARAAGYVNAGTCEFLLDRQGQFYFLEMNTRLQVEHPVTEFVTGIDLVQWQLRIASGERLTLPSVLEPRGWSIECRITSEDPWRGFLPSTGEIGFLQIPQGPGVRWDAGIDSLSEVTRHYDSLLGKLIVWGPSRSYAVQRMRRALRELRVVGVDTSRELLLRILEHDEFANGQFDIQWLEARLPSMIAAPPHADEQRAAAIAAALLAERDRVLAQGLSSDGTIAAADPWRAAARRDAVR
jgi:acetyl-CoA carboxylase, biotin carboxylase subunit